MYVNMYMYPYIYKHGYANEHEHVHFDVCEHLKIQAQTHLCTVLVQVHEHEYVNM
jgi:hypothetical protein